MQEEQKSDKKMLARNIFMKSKCHRKKSSLETDATDFFLQREGYWSHCVKMFDFQGDVPNTGWGFAVTEWSPHTQTCNIFKQYTLVNQ
ncbi:MAG: hypothetical protein ACYCUI_15760 [Vulcanimicrobiaceae bacterium]